MLRIAAGAASRVGGESVPDLRRLPGGARLVAAALLLPPEEEDAAERGDARRQPDRRLVRPAALDRGHGRLRLLARHALADVPRQPAEHSVPLVDDAHVSLLLTLS